MPRILAGITTMSILVMSGCSSGTNTTTSASSSTASGPLSADTTAGTAPTLFNLPNDTRISVNSTSAERNISKSEVRAYAQDFWFKSRSETDAGVPLRRLRYGKPFPSYHPHRNYTIPITVTTSNGQTVGTGIGTFSGDKVETGVTTRTITLTDIQLDNSIFGLFNVEDTGQRGDFYEIHAYAGGIDATNLPASATYTGRFYGDVISGTATTATRIELASNLSVDFAGGTVTGAIGDSAAPDISLTGTVSGSSMTGTATVNSGALTVANGATGAFSGGFYGDGAPNAAGTLGVSDSSGAVEHELVGAFGATKN